TLWIASCSGGIDQGREIFRINRRLNFFQGDFIVAITETFLARGLDLRPLFCAVDRVVCVDVPQSRQLLSKRRYQLVEPFTRHEEQFRLGIAEDIFMFFGGDVW